MNVIKNIIVIFFFMMYLMEIVYSGGKTQEHEECVFKICEKFGYDSSKRYQYRITIPRLAFRYKLYYMLVEEGEDLSAAQRFYVHIYDILCAKKGTKTPLQWCQQFTDIPVNVCYEELKTAFAHLDEPTEIVKYAYLNLIEDSLRSGGKKARKYFRYLLKKISSIDGEEFMTPLEICQGKTKATPQHNKEDQVCVLKIHEKFGFDSTKRYRLRNIIPRLAFRFKLYYMLAEEGEGISLAQLYFVHIYDLLRAKEGTQTPYVWCGQQCTGFSVNECYEELKIVFQHIDEPTEIMKYAYLNLIEDSFRSVGENAQKYFHYLLKKITSIDGEEFMTPLEFCQGKTKATPQHNKGKKRNDPDYDEGFEKSLSKIQRIDYTLDNIHLKQF